MTNLTNDQLAELLHVIFLNEQENLKRGSGRLYFPRDPVLFQLIYEKIFPKETEVIKNETEKQQKR